MVSTKQPRQKMPIPRLVKDSTLRNALGQHKSQVASAIVPSSVSNNVFIGS